MSGCTRCATPLEEGDLRCAVCALAAAVPAAATSAKARARVLRCEECAAAVAYSADDKALKCGFCGAVMKVEEPVDPIEKAQILLPFRLDKDQATEALRGWLSKRGFFRPGDLASAATLHNIRPLFWAAWVCRAKALLSWTADSDAGSHRSSWAPHSGETHVEWDNLLISASRGLSLQEANFLAERYDLTGTTQVGETEEAIEQFELQRSAARKTILEAIERSAAARLQRGTIPGSRFRKVHVGVLLEQLGTSRIALPCWILAYRYGGDLYRAVVHGQDPQVVTGSAPVSWMKILLVVGIVAAVIALLVILFTR
jgi:hypothetical protein